YTTLFRSSRMSDADHFPSRAACQSSGEKSRVIRSASERTFSKCGDKAPPETCEGRRDLGVSRIMPHYHWPLSSDIRCLHKFRNDPQVSNEELHFPVTSVIVG